MLQAIAGTLLVLACVLARDRAVPAPLDVRYVANAGVLLTIDGRKILIDAPIRDGIPPYPTPSADERARLEAARPPYDGIAAILITHWHEDHLSPDAVAAHLRSSARTVLISSREVVDRVRQAGPDLPAARFRAVTPAPGSSTVAEIEGLRVYVLRIRHNPARRLPAEHVGFLVQGTEDGAPRRRCGSGSRQFQRARRATGCRRGAGALLVPDRRGHGDGHGRARDPAAAHGRPAPA